MHSSWCATNKHQKPTSGLPHLAGKGFDRLLLPAGHSLLPPLLGRASVFARMSPDNKRHLMLLLGDGMDVGEAPGGRPPHLGLHAGETF